MATPSKNTGSDVTELKTLFKLAQNTAVNAAFGLDTDGKVIIKLDKTTKPKALAKALSDMKVKPVYCGKVGVDPSDTTTANFTVNKAVSGLQGKLIVALKGSGVSKVNIVVGEGEDATDEGDQPTNGGGLATQGDDLEEPASQAAPPDAPAPDAPGSDVGALTQQLTALVKQMMTVVAGDPGQKATLMPLAVAAQTALKQGNLAQAASGMASLQQALAGGAAALVPSTGGGPSNQQASPGGRGVAADAATFARSSAAWTAARKKVESEIDKLKKELLGAFSGHDAMANIEQAFQKKMVPMMESLDTKLSDKLAELAKAENSERPKLVGEAHTIIEGYRKFMDSEPLIKSIDNNPFVPVAIEKTLMATLAVLEKNIS